MDKTPLNTGIDRREMEASGLISTLFRYIGARGTLLSLDAQEAAAQFGKSLALLFFACLAAFTGWLLLMAALVSALTCLLHCHWHTSAFILGIVNAAIAIALSFMLKNHLSSVRWFADTVNEFKKDREWLNRPTEKD